ncbi:hypothetical protein P4283_22880 [Bacillus thuringiensis]|nr:hypothetical protein [Bacillus thuringiensis]
MKLSYDYYITPGEYKRAERNGISQSTLNRRVRVAMMNKEKAITELLMLKDSQWSKWKGWRRHTNGYLRMKS